MTYKDKVFWLHLFAVVFPPIAAVLAPILQASGNPLAIAGALALTSLAAYHWGASVNAPAPTQAAPGASLAAAPAPDKAVAVSLDATPPAK